MRPAGARAGCRVDLAGGTLDIWPLGLLHRGSRTVNVTLDLEVAVRIEPRSAGYRVDGGAGIAPVEVPDLDALADDRSTGLVAEVLAWLEMPPAEIRIRSASPRGAGLGGSSAVTVALLAAAWRAVGREIPAPLTVAAVARDLEARLMGLPTGMQDHLPALLGGSLEIVQAPGGAQVLPLPVDLGRLGDSLVVVYTGVSHFSAGANWGIVRRRLDGDGEVTGRLQRIAETAVEMATALRAGDFVRSGQLMSQEWEARRGLHSAISTPEVERLLEVGQAAGAWGGKACGAGGGGCVALLAPPGAAARVRAACEAAGGRVLPTRPSSRGLELDGS